MLVIGGLHVSLVPCNILRDFLISVDYMPVQLLILLHIFISFKHSFMNRLCVAYPNPALAWTPGYRVTLVSGSSLCPGLALMGLRAAGHYTV